jgi:GT2 family glycosyltransferase
VIESDQKWAACIVYYQDLISLNNLLSSLDSQTLKPTQAFIADNNSEQPIQNNSYSFPIKTIRLNENKGFASGANVALKEAIQNNFENLMLLSQDVLLEKDSANKLINQLNISKGIVFPTMMNRKTNKIFSKGGKINKFWGSIKLSTQSSPIEVDWADGSCLAFKAETYNAVNGINEKYFMYFEDVDFCWQVKNKGFNLTHVETITSQTPKGPTPLLRSRNSILFARRTKLIYLQLSVTKRNLVGVLTLIIRFRFIDSVNRLKGIIQGWTVPSE